jgi:hypothetical protein
MQPIRKSIAAMMIVASGLSQLVAVHGGEPPKENEVAKSRNAVEKARDRAENMHEVYEATLEMLHHRYFHRDRSLLPARAMEDIFADMKRRTNVDARWISVNTKAMNIDHEPKSDFEKQAAKEIAGGKPAFETVDSDVYRRATAIPLKAGCVGCHAGAFAASSKTPRFAGLVISVPLSEE